MFFKSEDQCKELMGFLGKPQEKLEMISKAEEAVPNSLLVQLDDSKLPTYVISKNIVSLLDDFQFCLLWVTEFGIWRSRENQHLFYRVRSSYGEQREINLAPGHFFLDYEQSDLITFLDLVLQFGWGGYLVAPPNLVDFFISHDGWVYCHSDEQIEIERLNKLKVLSK